MSPKLPGKLYGKLKRRSGVRSLILTLLFVVSIAVSPAVAKMAQQPQILQSQSVERAIAEARQLYQTGRFAAAVEIWQRAAESLAARGDILNQAMALSNLSLTYQQLGRRTAAKKAIASSLDLLPTEPETLEESRILAQTLDIQGKLQLTAGQAENALETWVKSADIYARLNDRDLVAQNRINRAQAMQDLGLYPRACKLLLKTLELDRRSCQLSDADLQTLQTKSASPVNILALNALGNVLRVVGSIDRSQQVLEESQQLAEELGDPQTIASVSLNLGNTLIAQAKGETFDISKQTEYRQAGWQSYQRAGQLATSPITQLQAQLNQLRLLVENENWSQAEAFGKSLQLKLNNLLPGKTGIYAKINWADSWMRLAASGRRSTREKQALTNDINRLLVTAAGQAKELGDQRTYAYTLGSLGKLYELEKQWGRAEELTQAALNLAPAFKSPDIAYQMFWQLGRIEKATGKKQEAIAAYTEAANTLESLRGDLAIINPEVQFSFQETVEPVYRELVDLILSPGETQPPQENLRQARDLMESLQLAELDNFFQEACLAAKPEQIEGFDPQAAVIYPIILPNRLAVILSLPEQPLRFYATDIDPETVEQTVFQLRQALRPVFFAQQRSQLSQQVYDWLIRPAEAELAASDVETLVFVLDGALRNIPMAALYDGQQYLVEKYRVALAPGLQLLEARSLDSLELNALTVGLSEGRQGFAPLPGVKFEVGKIAAELSARVILNSDFTNQTLQTQIEEGSFPIVHLATHGQFSSNAEDTFLLTWDGNINVKELDRLLRSRERPQQASPIELLVLSACQTAAGDKRAVLGLAGVAVRSGARSTLATLWQVNDASTALMMVEFYRQLAQPGVTKAEALRNAQLSLLEQGRYRDPYYWAAFVLVGNWL